ncbi:MAG TPA: radical SAM protein [bacterium]|mgnify:CR=1 FL=1|nr:radical SAM protein [bacterium]HOL48386.1 radical SAM protein [bacterium]HPQ19705.1 radical SAM protein [bacterium]
MSILLINPPYTLEDRYGKNLKFFGGNAEPLGIAYIAANARKNGYNVTIIDAPAENLNSDQIANIISEKKYKLIGITMLTPMFKRVSELITKIKDKNKDVIIVLGGPHPTALPEETLKELNCDIICCGEGEHTFTEIADAILANKIKLEEIKGIYYKDKKNNIIKNPMRPFEKNIDNFPAPARDLLPMEKYFLTATRVKGTGFCGTVIIARGCPFNCTYCSHTFGRTFRAHSTERIIYEIEELINKYNATQINFEADTLTLNKKFIISLCDELIKRNINKKIKWTCESRIDTIDEEILRKMKEAGCWQISIGVESGSDRLLKKINKGITKSQIQNGFELIKKVGISIRGFFMIGLPTETKEETLETINFATKLNPDWAQFTITIPYPGTPLFDELKSKNEIQSFKWEDYRTWGGWTDESIPYITKGRTVNELKKLQKYALRKFYLRPIIFWKFLKSIDSLKTLKKYIKGLIILIKSK